MYKKTFLFLGWVLIAFFSCSEKGAEKVNPKLQPFELSEVKLLDSPFRQAMEKDEDWLLAFEPDRFLSGFRSESGLEPKAPKYGGWESQGVAGQTFGHYLSALAMMYASTGNELLSERIRYSVNELDSCQQAFDLHGLVAGFPHAKGLFEEISKGDIRTEGFDLNGGWVPFYTTHKLFAGLIDVCHYTGNKQAYEVLLRLADGFETILSGLSDEQIQKILVCEHGGINESMAEMYALTGEKRFIVLARRLNHQDVLLPLSQGRDELAGKHANTQIPKVLGVMRQYELTGDTCLLNTAAYFWNTVVKQHSYVIGGNSEAEHFGVPGRTYDRITDKTCENCNTYNMLKLTKHLFLLDPSVEKADYYERALYNQILASQNPHDGMVCYMSPLATGSRRWFSTAFESFWCCVGTGIENHARYGEFIYCTDRKDDLYVNLFIPSELNWKKRGMSCVLTTNFPASDTVRISFHMDKPQSFSLKLRYPYWAKKGFELHVNKERQAIQTFPGEYIELKRKWQDGDELLYVLPQSFSSEPALGDESLRAYLHGPIVLSGILPVKREYYPVVVADEIKDASSVLSPTAAPLVFRMDAAVPYPIEMQPYYKTAGEEVMVYFEHYTTGDWQQNAQSILMKQNREQWIRQQTVAHFRPGEMQPERDHHFRGEKLEWGEMQGRKYRKATEGGWFSFEMPVVPDQPLDLSASFWGNLGDIYKFDIEVDGTAIATVIIHWWGNHFVDKTYHIPDELTRGKEKITVTLRAINKRSVAGPLFDCKVLKRMAAD